MNVTFKIKLEEGDNKNFLVFISTELTKKLNFELMSTSTLRWEFKRNNAELAIQHGFYNQEVYEVVRNKGSYREEVVKETRNVLDQNILLLEFKEIESIGAVNDVFNIVSKYAKLIIDENYKEESNDELTELLHDEVAATVEG